MYTTLVAEEFLRLATCAPLMLQRVNTAPPVLMLSRRWPGPMRHWSKVGEAAFSIQTTYWAGSVLAEPSRTSCRQVVW